MMEVMCFWNGIILRTIDLRFIGHDVEIEPIDLFIQMIFIELLNMVYDIIGVAKQFQLILKYHHPFGVNKFQPLVVRNDRIVARMLAIPSKYEISSIELFIKHTPNHLRNDDIVVDEENVRDREDDIHEVVLTNEFLFA